MKLLSLTLMIIAGALVAQADILELKDGKLLNGTFQGGTTGTIRFQTAAGLEVYPVTSVLALTISRTGTPAPAAPVQTQVAPPSQAIAVPAAPSGPHVVRAGTEIIVKLRSTLSTASARAGQKFDAILETDLRAGSVIIAPRGSLVKGTITEALAPRRLRKAAALAFTLDSVTVGNRSILLKTNIKKTATGPDGSIIRGAAAGALVGELASNDAGDGALAGASLAALKKGDHIVYASGSLVTFRLASDIKVTQ